MQYIKSLYGTINYSLHVSRTVRLRMFGAWQRPSINIIRCIPEFPSGRVWVDTRVGRRLHYLYPMPTSRHNRC